MLQAYSTNITVEANAAIPFNSLLIEKGNTTKLETPSTIALNKCGIYLVTVNATVATAATLSLYKNGVAIIPATATAGGTAEAGSMSFSTCVAVPRNNSIDNPCSSPTTLQLINSGDATATINLANVVVTKIV